MGLFGTEKRRKGEADRRAGRVPHVGKKPRARNKDGRWRATNSMKGKRRPRKSLVQRLLG